MGLAQIVLLSSLVTSRDQTMHDVLGYLFVKALNNEGGVRRGTKRVTAESGAVGGVKEVQRNSGNVPTPKRNSRKDVSFT